MLYVSGVCIRCAAEASSTNPVPLAALLLSGGCAPDTASKLLPNRTPADFGCWLAPRRETEASRVCLHTQLLTSRHIQGVDCALRNHS